MNAKLQATVRCLVTLYGLEFWTALFEVIRDTTVCPSCGRFLETTPAGVLALLVCERCRTFAPLGVVMDHATPEDILPSVAPTVFNGYTEVEPLMVHVTGGQGSLLSRANAEDSIRNLVKTLLTNTEERNRVMADIIAIENPG